MQWHTESSKNIYHKYDCIVNVHVNSGKDSSLMFIIEIGIINSDPQSFYTVNI